MKTTKGILGKMTEKVQINVYSALIMLLITALFGSLMAMYSGAKAGSEAKKENIIQQEEIDSLKLCVAKDRENMNALKDLLERMDKRIEILYINELEGNK